MTFRFKGSIDDDNYLRVDDSIDQINKGMFVANNLMLLGNNIERHLTHLATNADKGNNVILTQECLDIPLTNTFIQHLISIAPGVFTDTNFDGDSLSAKIQSDIYEVESNECLDDGQGRITIKGELTRDIHLPELDFTNERLLQTNFNPEVV